MAKAYSTDLRWRVVRLFLCQRKSPSEIAGILFISEKSVRRYIQRLLRTGDVTAWRQRHGPMKILNRVDEFELLLRVIRNPTVYLRELSAYLFHKTGREASLSTLSRFLQSSNFSRKKLKTIASRRCEKKRSHFKAVTVSNPYYLPEMFVFIDEVGFDFRNGIRRYGYAPRGKEATEKFPVFYNKRKNTIAAISMSGVLDAVTYDHNVSGETFANFLRKNMLQHFQPFNGTNPHSIVVMDNASIHHTEEVTGLLQSIGVLVKFLPPYSPDLNPIEEVFSKVKYFIRAESSRLMRSAIGYRKLIVEAFLHVTKADCEQYISHSGYT